MKRFVFKRMIAVITAFIMLTSLNCGALYADGGATDVSSGISIDGLYDDWNSVPAQAVTHNGNNGHMIHTGQIYTDGEYLYFHVKLSPDYNSRMPFGQFNMSINGVSQEFHIYNLDSGYHGNQAPTEVGEYTNLGVGIRGSKTNWSPYLLTSNVIFTVHEEKHGNNLIDGAEFELKVPLSEVAEAFNVHEEDINTITITNSSLGSQGVSIAGTSSGPVIGVIIAVSMVAIGSYIACVKRKKALKTNENPQEG